MKLESNQTLYYVLFYLEACLSAIQLNTLDSHAVPSRAASAQPEMGAPEGYLLLEEGGPAQKIGRSSILCECLERCLDLCTFTDLMSQPLLLVHCRGKHHP